MGNSKYKMTLSLMCHFRHAMRKIFDNTRNFILSISVCLAIAIKLFLSRIQVSGTVARDCAFISQARGGQLWEEEN